MSFGVEGIAAASIDWSMYKVQSQYSTTLMKRAMDDMESQAMALINDMLGAVPSEYQFDVRA
jgi:hypothetical protein